MDLLVWSAFQLPASSKDGYIITCCYYTVITSVASVLLMGLGTTRITLLRSQPVPWWLF